MSKKASSAQDAAGCCFGIFLLGFAGCGALWYQGAYGQHYTPPPVPMSEAKNIAEQKGLIDIAGRVVPGCKIYSSAGDLFGTVVQDVTHNVRGEECVGIRKLDGTTYLLPRSAIRAGHMWYTDR